MMNRHSHQNNRPTVSSGVAQTASGASLYHGGDAPLSLWSSLRSKTHDSGSCSSYLAGREEGVRHDLRCLSSRGVRRRSEVWQTVGAARLPCPTTWVAVDDTTVTQSPDVVVEGGSWYNVLVLLRTGCFIEPCCVSIYLGQLASGDIGVGAEVR